MTTETSRLAGSKAPAKSAARSADSKKARVGMIYAIAAAPAFGLALGLLSQLVVQPPFVGEAPTGAFAIVALLEIPFLLLGVTVYLVVSGTWRDIVRVLGRRVSWWAVFVGGCGLLGDLCNATAAGLIGGALGGSVGGLTGVVGALLASVLYREKIMRWSTLLGLATMTVGIVLALSGGSVSAPTSGVYLVVGVLVMVGALLGWGFETFAISAGSDVLPPEGFLWWRVLVELLLANLLLFALFPQSRAIATAVWSDPRLISYGVVIGFGLAIWVTMGYFLGVSYAGAVRGGVLTNTLAFYCLSVMSLTVYGQPFSTAIIVGGVIMAVGTFLIVTEPSKHIAKLRG